VEKTFPVWGILSAKVAGLRMHNPAVDPAKALDEAGSHLFWHIRKVKKDLWSKKDRHQALFSLI
jgi:hypothetical protein